MSNTKLTIALPKGRLMEKIQEKFKALGYGFSFEKRKLVTTDKSGKLDIMLVKNSDMPVYINHGIAGIGICGDDVLYESEASFYRLLTLPFGGTKMCLAGDPEAADFTGQNHLPVATKFPKFTRDYFHNLGFSVQTIKLNGSVELAPVLGLTPYIVDLVETGSTLKAHNLKVFQELKQIQVHLIVNPAYYKINYHAIDEFVRQIEQGL
ncbi:MAG: ATP phosphoribosyltransferase [Spirochaetia bacterium]